MEEFVIILVSVLAGFVIGWMVNRERPLGDLRVDRSDRASEPLLFLELDTDVYTVMRKKRVTFRVRLEDILPHE